MTPSITFSTLNFPVPFGPTSSTNSPSRTVMSTPSTIGTVEYPAVGPATSSAALAVPASARFASLDPITTGSSSDTDRLHLVVAEHVFSASFRNCRG
jgi:hypothetical protein